jgi:hypothetical protein
MDGMRYWISVLLLIISAGMTAAQEDDLTAENVSVEMQTDAFGQTIQVAVGELVNEATDAAYTNINLYAELYDENDDLIGEGLGYPVNECGTALLDLALQPAQSQTFAVALELYEEGAEIERIAIIPQAEAVEVSIDAIPENMTGIEQVSDQEVVAIEWIDEHNLRYSVGCDGDVFTLLDWVEVNLVSGEITALDEHPNAQHITDAMLRQTGLTDPALFRRSFMSYHPESRRIVYQNDLNAIITAERDGSFKRIAADDLFRHSLHGIIWLPQGRFLAYYYGAYGDPVRYFVADMDGRRISESLNDVTLSQTIPGPTLDGTRAVITTTINDVTGYYLHSTVNKNAELLFEAEPPGNNYPAPLYITQEQVGAWIYIVRPVEGVNWLQCFDTAARELHDLTPLPLHLTSDDRAWTWLSPDGQTLVVAANGINGGLWTVDLTQFETCI